VKKRGFKMSGFVCRYCKEYNENIKDSICVKCGKSDSNAAAFVPKGKERGENFKQKECKLCEKITWWEKVPLQLEDLDGAKCEECSYFMTDEKLSCNICQRRLQLYIDEN